MQELKEWALEGNALVKEVNFPTFKETMTFVNDVAQIAEQTNHHPTMLIFGTTVRVSLTTREAGGLTDIDFDLAKSIDTIQS